MIYVIVRHGGVLYRGDREECLAAAERYGLLLCLGTELDDAGEPRRVLEVGRSFHPDGTELPGRLVRDCMMIPEQMLPRRFRRAAE